MSHLTGGAFYAWIKFYDKSPEKIRKIKEEKYLKKEIFMYSVKLGPHNIQRVLKLPLYLKPVS